MRRALAILATTLLPAVALAQALAPAPVPAYPTQVAPPPAPPVASYPAPPPSQPPVDVATLANVVRGDFGLASAVGAIGVTYTRTFADLFGLEGGLGWGFSGVQLSLMPKLFLGSAHHRLVLGVGPSMGVPTESHDSSGDPTAPIGYVNVEFGYDLRTESGVAFEIALGATTVVSHTHWDTFCIDSCVHVRSGDVFPTLRIGVGHWF